MNYIDVQHTGKPKRPTDMGAAIGEAVDEREAYWTSLYAFFMEMSLRSKGYKVMRLSDGSYKSRHDRVNYYEDRNNDSKDSIYISCHLNAGGGGYGAFFYDFRSTKGSVLADCLASTTESLPHISTVKKISASPSDWTKNAYHTFKGVSKPVAICAEPIFIDNSEHQHYLDIEQIQILGQAMADGIHLWYIKH